MHQIQQQRLCKSVELEERARHSGNRQPSRQRAWHHVYSGARGSIPGTNSPASNPQTAGSPVPMLSACSWQPGKISCRESTATKGIPVGTIPGDNRQTADGTVAPSRKGLQIAEIPTENGHSGAQDRDLFVKKFRKPNLSTI